jgi:hypothetical protein
VPGALGASAPAKPLTKGSSYLVLGVPGLLFNPRNKKRVDAYNVALSEQVGTDRIPDPVAAWLKSDGPTWPTS